jgi:two-component system phosphate regulon sensor histidine kinase PhoR
MACWSCYAGGRLARRTPSIAIVRSTEVSLLSLRRYLGWIYGVLVLLIISIGVWWIVFLTYEGRHYEHSQLERMAADRANAAVLLRSSPEIRADPERYLGAAYPYLAFRTAGDSLEVAIRPEAIAKVKREAGRRKRMFTAEGSFLFLLLAAGSTILLLSFRSEREFKRARELFLTGATHELKTPLASLRLYTETLGRKELGEDDSARIRSSMLDDVERLETLLEQILALGYDEDPSRSAWETIDPAEETEGILRGMRGYLAAHNARVETDLAQGHAVSAPRSILALVIRNLITNAVKHSPAPADVSVSLRREGHWLRLAVKDQGPGIPRRFHQKIFEGYVHIDDQGGASRKADRAGLGLYLVRRQTRMMGGRVEIESGVGKGSTFTLVLPASDREPS